MFGDFLQPIDFEQQTGMKSQGVYKPWVISTQAREAYAGLERLFNLPTKARGVLKCVKFSLWSAWDNDQPNKLTYVLKGIRPEALHKLKAVFPEFNRMPSNEGMIIGQRIGWSR